MTGGNAWILRHKEEDKFSIDIFAHDMRNGSATVSCWTYVTQGFTAHGQKEIVFILRRQLNEKSPPWDLREVLRSIYSLAEKGDTVDVGGTTYFQNSEDGIFGFKEMLGFAYVRPVEMPGVNLKDPNRYVLAILMVPGEPEFSQIYGPYRILTRLGRNAFKVPWPPWSDRRRKSMITKDDWEHSWLTKAPPVFLSGSYLLLPQRLSLKKRSIGQVENHRHTGGSATLFLAKEDEERIAEVLNHVGTAPEFVFQIILVPAKQADAHLAWRPSDENSQINAMAGRKLTNLTGGFVTLGVGPDTQLNGGFVEDGFLFAIPTSMWPDIRSSLAARNDTEFLKAAPGRLGLSIKFLSNSNDKPWWRFW